MGIIKKIIIAILFIILTFVFYAIHVKQKFDIVYANRENPILYKDLYDSGALDSLYVFVSNSFDSINATSKGNKNDTLLLKINLYDLKETNSNKKTIEAIDKIIKKGFVSFGAARYNSTGEILIHMRYMYLQYETKPTYHYILYETVERPSYRFSQKSNWYYFSFDDREHDFSNFLDPRPEWSLPYFEAFEFFERNEDY